MFSEPCPPTSQSVPGRPPMPPRPSWHSGRPPLPPPASRSPPLAPCRPSRSLPPGLPTQDQHVLMSDIRDERARVPVRPQPRPGLVPNHVALYGEPGARGPICQIGAREQVSPILVGVADDHRGVSVGPQYPQQLPEDLLHPGQEGGV